MARGLSFHYVAGGSILHGWDARCKILGLSLLTLATLHANETLLVCYSSLFLGAFGAARLRWKLFLSDFKPWGILLAFIFLAKIFFDGAVVGENYPFSIVNPQNIIPAALTCWRLALLLCYALLFTSVTPPRQLQEAICWFLDPIPFIPARRIALMVTLTIRFVPLLMDQYEEIQMAIRARQGNNRSNPARRIVTSVSPLLRRSLIQSGEIAFALAARGYREDLPLDLPAIPLLHWLPLLPLLLAAMGSLLGFPGII